MNPTTLNPDGLPPELCRPENNPPIDLVEIESSTPTPLVDLARQVCWECPLLVECRQWSLRNDVWGVAGGMTRAERQAWAKKHHVTPIALDIVDVTPTFELDESVMDNLTSPGSRADAVASARARLDGTTPSPSKTLPPRLIEAVLRLTREGITAEDIVSRLSHTGLTHPTVNFIRRTYAKGVSRVES